MPSQERDFVAQSEAAQLPVLVLTPPVCLDPRIENMPVDPPTFANLDTFKLALAHQTHNK
jgi:hypothetical protein